LIINLLQGFKDDTPGEIVVTVNLINGPNKLLQLS